MSGGDRLPAQPRGSGTQGDGTVLHITHESSPGQVPSDEGQDVNSPLALRCPSRTYMTFRTHLLTFDVSQTFAGNGCPTEDITALQYVEHVNFLSVLRGERIDRQDYDRPGYHGIFSPGEVY